MILADFSGKFLSWLIKAKWHKWYRPVVCVLIFVIVFLAVCLVFFVVVHLELSGYEYKTLEFDSLGIFYGN